MPPPVRHDLPANAVPPATGATRSPAPEQIRSRRVAARLTQARAAALISGSKRAWQDWEAGIARMHPGLWELFALKTAARVGEDGHVTI